MLANLETFPRNEGLLTNVCACRAIRDCMEQANQATGVADSLLVPNNLFVRAIALIFWPVFVFLDAELFVCLAHGKHKEEGMGRPRYKGKEFGVVDTEDVVEGKLVRQTELVNEGRHDLRVVLCRMLLGVCRGKPE